MAYVYGMNGNYFTEAMLKTITEAIGTGALSVYYGDKRVEYRSLDQMIRIMNIALLKLGHAQPGSGRNYAEFNKGIQGRCYGENDDPHYFD